MIFKLGHTKDIEKLLFEVTGWFYDNLFEFLVVLDNEYGEGRDIDHDDGGYVLLGTPGTTAEEIKAYFDFTSHVPEWVDTIANEPEYYSALFMLWEDYSTVLLLAKDDFKRLYNALSQFDSLLCAPPFTALSIPS